MGVLLNKGGRESAKESESERDGVGGGGGGPPVFLLLPSNVDAHIRIINH